MDAGLLTAGIISAVLALAHETLGLVWVLPIVKEQPLARTPFGSPALTRAMIDATWHLITVFVLAISGILIMLSTTSTDPTTGVLRIFAVMWFVATLVASSTGLKRVRMGRDLIGFVVPTFFLLVSILCWEASA